MDTPFDTLSRARWSSVGRRFLQQRPWIVAVATAGNGTLLMASGAPRDQLIVVALLFAMLVAMLFVEARALATRQLREFWLSASLVITALAIGVGCACTGGLESPLLPLLFAPFSVGFAAFGSSPPARLLMVIAVLEVPALSFADRVVTWPIIQAPWRGWMFGWSTLVALALLHAGITGLVEAYRSVARSLERMRSEVIEETALRAREAENLGAKVAHEIRNPLTAIKGLLQLLAPKAEGERDKQRHAVMQQEIDRIERIIDGYLSMARPLSDLSVENIDADELVRAIATLIEGRAAQQRVRVSTRASAGRVNADPRRLREAMLNLCQNALDAMPEGGELTLIAERVDRVLRLSVVDTGNGMSPALLARVGGQFVTERAGGTGLGLAIARGVARQHGGDLRLESTIGVGTSASMELQEES